MAYRPWACAAPVEPEAALAVRALRLAVMVEYAKAKILNKANVQTSARMAHVQVVDNALWRASDALPREALRAGPAL